MKKTDSLKKKILDELERVAIVQVACERCDVSRNTFYRWRKEDVDFSVAVDESIAFGLSLVCDMAESGLFKATQNQEPWAIKYLLSRKHRGYRYPQIVIAESNSEEGRRRTEDAMRRAKKMLKMWTEK